jgi:pyruvate/2-oxoglutarate dehydrogenase complex dihydrolipoamide acyltransferase (E2) component
MSSTTLLARALILLVVAGSAGCDKEEQSATATNSAAASAPAPSAPTPSAPAPSASAPAPSVPLHDCPAGSSGDASLAKPCDAKGAARMMEVTWTGKMTDTGPSFRVVNKSPSVILYGKMVAYFYDKAGKQLDVKDSAGKTHPHHTCLGNLFGGVMKPAEKAVITFSCVKKDTAPEGTAQIEAEMETVGFADATEKKSEWFWRNKDLTPDTRPKGGVK